MRFQPNQTIFVVHFGHNKDLPRTYGFFGMPMLFNNNEPDDINFIKLEVTEHHKVPNSYDAEKKLECDGYLLKDETGQTFANQYPTAAYGQTSDEGDRRFAVHITEKGMLDKLQAENPKVIFEGHLLSAVLERIQRGIKDLKEVTGDGGVGCHEKASLLEKLYARIVKEFHEKYPDYQLNMVWKPLMKTGLLWPDVSIYKRVSSAKAKAMMKEDITKDFNSDGRFEVEFRHGDRLIIEQAEGTYYIAGVMIDINTINVYYAEKFTDDDGKTAFNVHQTGYFPRDWDEMAVDSFVARLNDKNPHKACSGMTLDAIAARNKPFEGIQQVGSL